MVQLLDRYRRLLDGKAFAVVKLGESPGSPPLPESERTILLEAEDGERVESRTTEGGHGRFKPIED